MTPLVHRSDSELMFDIITELAATGDASAHVFQVLLITDFRLATIAKILLVHETPGKSAPKTQVLTSDSDFVDFF